MCVYICMCIGSSYNCSGYYSYIYIYIHTLVFDYSNFRMPVINGDHRRTQHYIYMNMCVELCLCTPMFENNNRLGL